MKKILKYVLSICIACLSGACLADLDTDMPHSGMQSTDEITISLLFPDMQSASTRAFGPTAPDLTDLDIFMFIFDGTDLLQTIHVDNPEWADNGGEDDNRIKFSVQLPQTDKDAVFHFVAIDDSDGSFAAQIAHTGYGPEDIVMPSFSVSGEKDAYWQRIELGCPIIKTVINDSDPMLENIKGTEDKVQAKFSKPVPLVRNFARIKLTKSEDVSDNNFVILGWCVVNSLNGGSVVPWFSPAGTTDIEFPAYADLESSVAYNYDVITASGYHGVLQTGTSRQNPMEDLEDDAGLSWSIGDKYIYERRNTSVNPLFLLLYGSYNNGTPGYYKIALGYTDTTTGLFTEYNVIRNIEYSVVINRVATGGYATPSEAAAAPSFNNVSADVTTRNMYNISDGMDILYVNFVNYVITQPNEEIEFRYRYISDIKNNGGTLANELVKYDWTDIGLPGGSNDPDSDRGRGAVIASWNDPVDADNGEWKSIKIKAYNPTDELKQQSFTIFSKQSDRTSALSRKINLILRNPWDIERIETYPRHWEDDSRFPDYDPDDDAGPGTPDSDANRYIGAQKGAPLTVFFELPAGLPEAMFPLDFVLESDRQNIESAGVGTSVVKTGPSLFEGVANERIQFVKTVRWDDYAPDGESSTPASRIIRVRFATTTDISMLDDDAKITTIRLYNPYFNVIDDKFERDQNVFVDPSLPYIWDFSSYRWSILVSGIVGTDNALRYGYIEADGLRIAPNSTNAVRRIYSGQVNDDWYIRLPSYTEPSMTFSMTYGASNTPVTGILRITASSENSGTRYIGNLNVTATNVTVTPPEDISFAGTERTTKDWTLTVPANTALTTIVTTKATSNAVRIFKVEFYPLGDAPELE